MTDMLETHGLDKMLNERIELGLQDTLKKAQKGDSSAFLLASLAQSNIYLIERLRRVEARLEKLEGRENG